MEVNDMFDDDEDMAQYSHNCVKEIIDTAIQTIEQEVLGKQEPVATLHRDGCWTCKAGKEPFDPIGQATSLSVFASPQPCPKCAELGQFCEKEMDKLREIIAEQLRTIVSLNDALGGEGSLTTDNLVRVGRLEAKIKELERDNGLQRVIIEQKMKRIAEQETFIKELEAELARYREREKTMGWNQN